MRDERGELKEIGIMACLTLKSGAIVIVDDLEAFSEALGEKGRQELRKLLETARPELQLVKLTGPEHAIQGASRGENPG